MKKQTKQPNKKDLSYIVQELKSAGIEVATTGAKPSQNPYYSSVSREKRGILAVK